jgi:hypothetical protein
MCEVLDGLNEETDEIAIGEAQDAFGLDDSLRRDGLDLLRDETRLPHIAARHCEGDTSERLDLGKGARDGRNIVLEPRV